MKASFEITLDGLVRALKAKAYRAAEEAENGHRKRMAFEEMAARERRDDDDDIRGS